MTFSKLISGRIQNNGKYNKRLHPVSGMIMHHAASTNFTVVKGMMEAPYHQNQLSANYLINSNGKIYGCVPEEFRAFTSGDADWDGRSITFECINETGAPAWKISAKAQEAIAKLLADVAKRYGFLPKRGKSGNVFGHRELYEYFGASYATACPGGMPVDSITKRALEIMGGEQKNPAPSNSSGRYAPSPSQLVPRKRKAVTLKINKSGKTSIAVGKDVKAKATVLFRGRPGALVHLGLVRSTYIGSIRTGNRLIAKSRATIGSSGTLTMTVSKDVTLNRRQRLRINAKALGKNSVRAEVITWNTQ